MWRSNSIFDVLRVFTIVLCVCVVLFFSDRPCYAEKYLEIHGSWVIDLKDTSKESLATYFRENDEQACFTKASSVIFTFDAKTRKFRRSMPGKEEIYSITLFPSESNPLIWFQHVKFPDYIKVLPDGRLQYGCNWGIVWEFILQRKEAK